MSYQSYRYRPETGLVSKIPLASFTPIKPDCSKIVVEDVVARSTVVSTEFVKAVVGYLQVDKTSLSAEEHETVETINSMGRLLAHDDDANVSVVFEDGRPRHRSAHYMEFTPRNLAEIDKSLNHVYEKMKIRRRNQEQPHKRSWKYSCLIDAWLVGN